MKSVFRVRTSRRGLLRLIGASAGMAALATVLDGCGSSLPFVGGGKPAELVLGYGVDQLSTTGLDPQVHSGTAAESQLRNCYDCLVQISKDLKTVEPQLATSWTRVDPLTFQFKLRQDVKFHNGEDFDAEAVKFSIERPINPNTKPRSTIFATYANILDHVDIVDKYTVNIKTKKPDPLILRRMSGFNMTIIAPKWAAAGGSDKIKVEAQGTSAYRIVEWGGAGSDVVFEANDKYWGQPATVKRVRVKIIPEQATRSAALRSKDIHVTQALWPEDEAQIGGSGVAITKKVVSNRIPFYFFEVRKPPFDKKEVRQALNYGSNMEGIIKNVLSGNGTRTACITAPWHFGNNKELKPYPYDPQKAKDLLKQAGLADGFETNIWFIQGRYMKDKEVAEAIAQELGKIGVKVKPQLNDTTKNTQLDLARQQDGMIFASWGNWMFDVDNTYFPLFHSSARDTANDGKGQSSRPYGDPTFDKMLEDARVEIDDAKRQALYDKAEGYFYDQAPALTQYQLTDIYGISKQVSWDPRSDEMIWYREMSWA